MMQSLMASPVHDDKFKGQPSLMEIKENPEFWILKSRQAIIRYETGFGLLGLVAGLVLISPTFDDPQKNF